MGKCRQGEQAEAIAPLGLHCISSLFLRVFRKINSPSYPSIDLHALAAGSGRLFYVFLALCLS